MTVPGDATEVGHIIAYLAFDKSEWNRQLAEVKADVASLARLNPTITINTNSTTVITQLAAVRAASDQVARQAPNVRVSSNAQEQTFQMHALRDAILLLGPAAIPIAGVLGGAFIGALPAAAALILGIKGIEDEMKSGALTGTQYGADIASVKNEIGQLKTIAAGGILSGLDQALQSSSSLFPAVNTEIGLMSGQLGDIIGHAGPGLITLFTQLGPLFNTIGADLDRGAVALENFGASGDGVSSFVAYVQTELPIVEKDVGALILAVSHLTAGFVPFGNVALQSIGLVSRAISGLPIEDLQTLESTVLSGYVAWRTYSAISTVVIARNAAMAASARITALAQTAASAETEAAAAAEALTIAQAKAAETEAIAAPIRALEVWKDAYDATAIEVAAAAAAELTAAEAAAAGTAAAAQTAANAVRTSGAEAAGGWSAMLGPAAAVVVGVALLGSTMLSGSDDTKTITQSTNDYTQALRDSNGVINDNVRESIAKNLADDGTIAAGAKLGLTTQNLVDATLGNAAAQTKIKTALDAEYASLSKTSGAQRTVTDAQARAFLGTNQLNQSIKDQAKAFSNATTEAKAEADAIAAAKTKTDALSASNQQNAQLLGMTVTAYQAAQQAAEKNTQQAESQTQAWQLENNAGSLLQQTLDKLAGKQISYAEAENQFQQQLLTQAKNLADNKKGLDGLGESAIQNRADLLQLIQGAEQTADAYGTMTGSSVKAKAKLAELAQQIIDNAVAHGEDRKSVTAYVDSLLKIPKSVPPTKIDADNTAAAAKLAALKKQYDDLYGLEHVRGPLGVTVETADGAKMLADLQAEIDALQGKTLPITFEVSGYIKSQGAAGGQLNANIIRQLSSIDGLATGGSVNDGWFTVGEQGYELGYKQGNQVKIFSNPDSQKMTGQSKVPGYAGGTDIVTPDPTNKSKSSSNGGAGPITSSKDATLSSQFTALISALNGTTAQLSSAANALIRTADADGLNAREVAALRKTETTLLAYSAQKAAIDAKITAAKNEESNVSKTFQGSFNVATAGTGQAAAGVGPAVSFNAIYAQAKQQALIDQRFDAGLKKLASEGLSADYVQQLAERGPDAWPEVQALLGATPKSLKGLNAEEASIKKSATSIGATTATAMYGAGVNLGHGLIAGLQSQEKAVESEMVKFAHIIENTVRHELGIHSDSTVAIELGGNFSSGFATGITSKKAMIIRAGIGMSRAALPIASRTHASTGAMRLHPADLQALADALASRPAVLKVGSKELARTVDEGHRRNNRRVPV